MALSQEAQSVLEFFKYDHLPEGPIKGMARDFGEFANDLALACSANDVNHPQVAVGLQKLLDAKDCFVRAVVAAVEQGETSLGRAIRLVGQEHESHWEEDLDCPICAAFVERRKAETGADIDTAGIMEGFLHTADYDLRPDTRAFTGEVREASKSDGLHICSVCNKPVVSWSEHEYCMELHLLRMRQGTHDPQPILIADEVDAFVGRQEEQPKAQRYLVDPRRFAIGGPGIHGSDLARLAQEGGSGVVKQEKVAPESRSTDRGFRRVQCP